METTLNRVLANQEQESAMNALRFGQLYEKIEPVEEPELVDHEDRGERPGRLERSNSASGRP
jgi:hypothetical protein